MRELSPGASVCPATGGCPTNGLLASLPLCTEAAKLTTESGGETLIMTSPYRNLIPCPQTTGGPLSCSPHCARVIVSTRTLTIDPPSTADYPGPRWGLANDDRFPTKPIRWLPLGAPSIERCMM